MDFGKQIERAKEEIRQREEHRVFIDQAIANQRRSLFAEWSPIVRNALAEVGRATWGPDTYNIIESDATRSFTWTAVCERGAAKLNYKVTLEVSEVRPDDPTLTPNDRLVTPVEFRVVGAQEFSATVTQAALEEALLSAFRVGPKDGGLDKYEEAILARTPYKKGEYGKTHWQIGAAVAFALLIASGLLFGGLFTLASSGVDVGATAVSAGGLLLLGLSVPAALVTQMGKRFKRLRPGQKALAVLGALPGYIVIIWNIVAIIAIIGWIGREIRIGEIAEAIRRALRKQ
ncbi:MAG: hypothetical protein QXP27_06485 [Candidatus Methanomethyliaceae archaeon]